ncbi:hypothetical protein KSP39_PZI014427 [Platanthera zijinensis]|uniref:Uncharacterized protein n=1 Tax=Platanthera zijinensis TaxID=2320716 RepID=A0AAP0G2H7_9ASPA
MCCFLMLCECPQILLLVIMGRKLGTYNPLLRQMSMNCSLALSWLKIYLKIIVTRT